MATETNQPEAAHPFRRYRLSGGWRRPATRHRRLFERRKAGLADRQVYILGLRQLGACGGGLSYPLCALHLSWLVLRWGDCEDRPVPALRRVDVEPCRHASDMERGRRRPCACDLRGPRALSLAMGRIASEGRADHRRREKAPLAAAVFHPSSQSTRSAARSTRQGRRASCPRPISWPRT